VTGTATARRLATATAYGGGGVGLAGAALFALLRKEARAARRVIEARNLKETPPPSGNGVYGRGKGKPLVFTVLGDSSAVGLGVARAEQTPGVFIA
jgi:hypothetical protein